jgi:hypothetical protein
MKIAKIGWQRRQILSALIMATPFSPQELIGAKTHRMHEWKRFA